MNSRPSLLNALQELLGQDINVSLIVSSFKKSILWILFLLIIAIVSISLYLRYTLPVYESTFSIIYKPGASTEASIMGFKDVLSTAEEDIVRELQFFKSRTLSEVVAAKLNLQVSYFLEGKSRFISSEIYRSSPFLVNSVKVKDSKILDVPISFKHVDNRKYELQYQVSGKNYSETFPYNSSFENNFFEIEIIRSPTNFSKEAFQDRKHFFVINNMERVYKEINSGLTVTMKDRKTAIISYQNNNPNIAKDILENSVATFLELNKKRKSESADQIIAFLETKIDSFRNDLMLFQDSLRLFRIENKFINPENMSKIVSDNLSKLESQKMDIEYRLKVIKWFEDYIDETKDIRMLSAILLEGEMQSLSSVISSIKELEFQRENLSMSNTREHPRMIRLDNKANELLNEVKINIDNARDKIAFKSSILEEQYQKNIAEMFLLPEKEAEYVRLMKKLNMIEGYYNLLLDKLSTYTISKQGIVSDYITLEKASTAIEPVSPKKIQIWLIGIVSVFVVGLIMILARYILHTTIISVDEIRRSTKAAFLGVIPTYQEDMKNRQIVVSATSKTMMSEAFRTIRSNMQFIDNSPGPKVIAITSSISGEGKTFSALNIAAILSLLEKKVVLLDFDMRRPRLNQSFDVDNDKGVSTILIGRDTYQECLRKTELENLQFITSGPIPPNPAELILSANAKKLIQDLKQKFDYVIVDTPPIGLVTDGLEMIQGADFPIYVFRADYSDRAFINNLDKLIDENKVNHLSFILNDVGRGVSGYYYDKSYTYSYSYGYGYGAGYYVEEPAAGKKSTLRKLIDIFSGEKNK